MGGNQGLAADWRELTESLGEGIPTPGRVNGLCKGREVGMGTSSLGDCKQMGLVVEEGAMQGTARNQVA